MVGHGLHSSHPLSKSLKIIAAAKVPETLLHAVPGAGLGSHVQLGPHRGRLLVFSRGDAKPQDSVPVWIATAGSRHLAMFSVAPRLLPLGMLVKMGFRVSGDPSVRGARL